MDRSASRAQCHAGASPLERIRRDLPQTCHGVEAPRLVVSSHQSEAGKGKPMEQITRGQIVRVGVDLAKHVIQVHGVDGAGRVVVAKALARDRFMGWCAQLPPGCVVAMESCGGAHHWARKLAAMGLQPRLIAGHFVGPYRMQGKRGKNDANDAAAVCEAASRPSMRFVPVKTAMQQGQLAVHRLREGYKQERTACINRIRGLLTEFGVAIAQSPEALRRALPEVLEDASNELPALARMALQRSQLQWVELDHCLVR